ncbi:MAG: hypothetical protein FJ265_16820 [Planctomycetes bacterium]|nr:hypothetical protein [Planctomycetota bacterium]
MGKQPFDLTGTWTGHYEQHGGRHGITMTVVHKGSALMGQMRDADTVSLGSARVLHTEGEGGQVLVLGDAETMWTLPERSVIEGSVDGNRVVFEKRYLGEHVLSVWFRGRTERETLPDHRVWYEGEVVEQGNVLRGQWRIPARIEGGPEARGGFELRRERAAAKG